MDQLCHHRMIGYLMNKYKKNYLAFDLGASNIRCMAGSYDGTTIRLDTISQHDNYHEKIDDHYYWNMTRIFDQIKLGLGIATETFGNKLSGIGVDSWGVDFGLLDENGCLLGNPFAYRDPQTEGMLEEAFQRVSQEEIFDITGIVTLRLNTLYQLLSLVLRNSPLLKKAHTYLMISDLINYFLTGQAVCNYTTASTSQLLDARKREWALSLIRAMGIPDRIFPEIVMPGKVLGKLETSIGKEMSISNLPVISIASHDTASAFAAVPSKRDDVLYLSSGTWGLMGALVKEPIINRKTLAYNLSNVGGVFDSIRLLSVNPNLWLLQECRRIWHQEGDSLSWEDLIGAAEKSESFLAFINPSDDAFTLPNHMPTAVQQYCQLSGQMIPATNGEIARVCMESLAFQYRIVKERLTDVLRINLSALHIVGGGTKNRLLNQMAANACGIPVIAGPTEPAVLGNIMMQLIATGEISGLEEGRLLIADSFPTQTYLPTDSEMWNDAYQDFLRKTQTAPLMN